MNAIALVLKYAFTISFIAYLTTTNWSFYRPMLYLQAQGFAPLYLAALLMTALYITFIEACYCSQSLAHIKKDGGIPKKKRKFLFFLYPVLTVALFNLVLLYFAFSTIGQSLLSTRYLHSGLPFFLLVYLSYAALVWYRPLATLGFWAMERWVIEVMQSIEKKDCSKHINAPQYRALELYRAEARLRRELHPGGMLPDRELLFITIS